MKYGYVSKFVTIFLTLMLVLSTFGGFGSLTVRAQDTSTNYKLDVSYQKNYAQINGNSEDVPAGYQLESLTDDSTGEEYTPNNFSMRVNQNGTYSFTLTYTLNGISSQTQSEKITVVVDKLSQTNNSSHFVGTYSLASDNLTANVKISAVDDEYQILKITDEDKKNVDINNTTPSVSENGIHSYSVEYHNNITGESGTDSVSVDVEGIQEPKEISVQELKEQRANTIHQYTWNAYTDNGASLKKQITFNEGNILAGEDTGIPEKIDNYKFKNAVIIISGQYYEISAIYYLNGVNYYVPTKSGTTPGIAYQAPKDAEYRFIYSIGTQTKYDIKIDSGTTQNWNIKINAADDGSKAYEDQVVIVQYTYPYALDTSKTIGIKVVDSSNQNVTLESLSTDSTTRTNVVSFKMPRKNVTISGIGTAKTGTRYVGVYGAETPFQKYEYGMNGVKGLNSLNNLYYKITPKDGEYDSDGGSNISRNGGKGVLEGKDVTNSYYDSSTGSQVTETKSLSVATNDYTIGSELSFEYQVRRGKVGTDAYYYEISPYLVVDFFEKQGTYQTTDFSRELVKLPTPQESNLNKPLTVTLSNGTEVTATLTTRKGYYPLPNAWAGNDTVYKITFKNTVDDFRIGGGIVSSVQGSYTIGDLNGIATGSYLKRDFDESDNTSTNGKLGRVNLTTGTSFLAKHAFLNNGKTVVQFNLTTKEGYTIPRATITDSITGQQLSSEEKNMTQSSNWPSENTNDTLSWEYNFVPTKGHFTYKIDFNSALMKFNFVFKNNSGGTLESYNDYDVPNKRYFSIPQFGSETASGSGNYLLGWKLYVTIGNQKVQISKDQNTSNSLYNTSDLVDMKSIWNQILKKSKGNSGFDYNQTTYNLSFEPCYGGATSGAYVPSKYSYLNQTGWDNSTGEPTYTQKNSGDVYVIYGNTAIFTGYPEKLTVNSNEYTVNISNSILQKVIGNSDINNIFAKVNYDKKLSVTFTDSSNKLGITSENNGTVTTTDGNMSTITIPNKGTVNTTTDSSGKKFKGWYIVTSNGKKYGVNGEENGTPFAPGDTIQFGSKANVTSTVSNNQKKISSTLLKTLFDTGAISLSSEWQEDVASVQKVDGSAGGDTKVRMSDANYENSQQGKWIYSGGGETGRTDKHFTITGKFKYSGTEASYDAAKAANKIYYAFYKQNPNSNGTESTASYGLWKSTKNPNASNSNKVANVKFSDNLENQLFTVTVEVQNVSDSITYRWDNEANYRIYCWSSANNVSGNFGTDGYANTNIDNSTVTPNLPSYTTTTRVLEKIQTSGATNSQRINARKLIYNDQTLEISYDVTTGSTKMTQAEAEQEFNIAIGKQDPGSSNPIQLWYSRKAFSAYSFSNNGFTNQGGDADGVKLNKPVITIKDAVNNKSNKFTIKVTGIKDTYPINPKWQSEAKYYLYSWNGANSISPTVSNSNNNYTITNDSSDIPSKVYTTYVINDSGISGQTSVNGVAESAGKAFYGTISYPTNAKVQENTNTHKVESELMKIKLNAVWVNNSLSTVNVNSNSITPGETSQPVEHDFSYRVTLAGEDILADDTNTSVKLTQAATLKEIKANIVTSSGAAIQNGNLGTLDFYANNSNGVQELGFKVQMDSITPLTKDVFNGNIGYKFTRSSVVGR